MESSRSTLSDRVLQSLQNDIIGGRYSIGMRLPAESALAKQFGVSRTIVREVVAALKATGIVESRHGAGIYVLSQHQAQSTPALFEADYINLSDILEVMELRMAVEIEAAGLAAVRRTTAQLIKIFETVQTMEKSIEGGHSADMPDYEFHKAIAIATNNERYIEFFRFYQNKVIPRSRIQSKEKDPDKQKAYLQQIIKEHKQIYAAIAANRETEARQSMRSHLISSRNLYKTLFMQTSACRG